MNNFYETNSSRPINEGVNNVITKADSILRPYSNTASIVKDTAGVIFKGYKLIMAEKGLIRQIITGNKVESSPTKDGTGTLRDSGLPHLTQTQNINNTLIDRYDKSKDYYFRTGDYFLPLSFTISTSGEKKIEESQIIDGINVVERIAFAPIIAEISVKIEMAESKEENLWLTKVPNEYATIGQSQITELNMMLNDLNKNNEVFN